MTHDLQDPNRLRVLSDLGILDTPAEPAYDDIASLASACCVSPIAAVNFVDGERHWTKAIVGVENGQGASVAADVSFCAATVATGGLLSVPDTLDDDHWRSHPFVTGPPFLRSYAGAAIEVSGEPIGVVCVFGDKPRVLDCQQEQALIALAGQASANLELRRHNLELRELAVRDPLTGLANRTLLFDHLEMAIAERQRDGGHVGVLFCDVDGFKLVNDRLGHEAGDRLLCRIADALRAFTRTVDTVARFGGDEFVVVCPGLASRGDLDAVVERVERPLVNGPDAEDGISPRLSVGAALLQEGETAADLLRRADVTMYRSKAKASREPAPAPAEHEPLLVSANRV